MPKQKKKREFKKKGNINNGCIKKKAERLKLPLTGAKGKEKKKLRENGGAAQK